MRPAFAEPAARRRLRAVMPRAFAVALAGLAVAGAALVWAPPASAHARLESISPKHRSVQTDMPTEVVLTFNEPVNERYTELRVTGPDDARVSEGDPVVSGPKVRHRLKALTRPGRYTVAYRTVSVDGHVVSGEREFTYEPPATASASPQATPSESADAAGAGGGQNPSDAAAEADAPSTSPVVPILLGVVAVAIVAGAVLALRRTQRG